MKKLYTVAASLLLIHLAQAQIVINEAYGGGNNANAAYNNDFVELFNNSTTAVNIGGYKIEYFSASSGGSGGSVTIPAGTMLAGRTFFLIKLAGGTTNGAPLPSPDLTGNINLSATAGRVDLTNSAATLIDRVGYGSGAGLLSEGTPAPAPANPSSVERTPVGTDTDNNSADFTVKNPPTPQNSAAQSPLPIAIADFRAVQRGGKTELYWTNYLESDVTSYAVERSSDGKTFVTLAVLNPTGNRQTAVNYLAVDAAPLKDANFYRVKTTATDGKIAYTNVLRLNTQSASAGLSLYPNPVRSGSLNLQFSGLPVGKYTLRLINAGGTEVWSATQAIAEGTSAAKIDASRLARGFYTVQLAGSVNLSQTFVRE